MSADRGKPVHLTKGERRLLVNLLEAEMERLGPAPAPGATGPAKEVGRVHRLRLRQYRRLILELRLARDETPEALA